MSVRGNTQPTALQHSRAVHTRPHSPLDRTHEAMAKTHTHTYEHYLSDLHAHTHIYIHTLATHGHERHWTRCIPGILRYLHAATRNTALCSTAHSPLDRTHEATANTRLAPSNLTGASTHRPDSHTPLYVASCALAVLKDVAVCVAVVV